jgi:glycosyltransferase involved in cell wall biosynthesis
VSGVIPPTAAQDVDAGVRPRLDYFELARALDADLLDVAAARRQAGRIGRVVERLAGVGGLLAWVCFRLRGHYDAIVTDGEQVGLPLAALFRVRGGRRPRHAMVVHILSVRKKVMLYRALRLGGKVDLMFVYATRQGDFIARELGFPRDAIVLTTFMVDTTFWRPRQATHGNTICSAGLEFRDYPTLIAAVRDLDVRCVIAAGSQWSKRADTSQGVNLPPNVEVCSLDHPALRELYARSEIVVMPLQDVEFQAGVTTILEAMAMGKAVICSRTKGQTDVIVDGVTGVYVPPHDVEALRAVIQSLLADPARAAEMGAAARDYAVRTVDVRRYADRIAEAVSRLRAAGA